MEDQRAVLKQSFGQASQSAEAEGLAIPISNVLQSNSMPVLVAEDRGVGRALVVLVESSYRTQIQPFFQSLVSSDNKWRTLLLESQRVTGTTVKETAAFVKEILQEQSIRSATFIGFEAAASVLQELALTDLKMVRTLVLVNATTRPHPKLIDRLLARIEAFLPLGLPFRSTIKGFDARPYLQRIRCPVLVVTTPTASVYQRAESKVLAAMLPTAWLKELCPEEDIAKILLDFQDVPVKCPQKGRR